MTPYIRAGILEHFRSALEALGGDADRLLRQADVAPEVMTIPGIYLPYANYMTLMDLAARATGTPHFGLEMMRLATTETLGTTGIIMAQADTVGAAWQSLAHFYGNLDSFGTVSMWQTGSHAVMSYAIPGNHLPGARQVYDAAAGLATNIMKQFCGTAYRPTAVGLPYPEPGDLTCYAGLATEEIRFDANAMELYFERAVLERRLPDRKDKTGSALERYFANREVGITNRTTRRVEDIIRRLLPTGKCTLPLVAETLSTTDRTLQAHLESEHSSFRELMEKIRREIATYHLSRGDMQLTQLAMILGYSELSAFSRSFRRWYGESPRGWARRHRPRAGAPRAVAQGAGPA
jgi:AraC-like DNA-binding protein